MVKKRSKSSKKKEKCPKTSSHLPSPAPGLVEVFSTLEKRYGTPQLKEKLDPLDSLILTILSQNTTDTNSDRSFAALKAKFPTWLEVAHADESSIEKAIRCGGLAKIKAKNIRTILLDLEQRANGAPSLDYMATMSDKDVFSELTKMKGVGPKTAACVLLFSMGRQACGSPSIIKPVFNRNAFPVDTHVHRVSRRLGLVSFDSSREQTQEKLEGKVPTDWMYKVFFPEFPF